MKIRVFSLLLIGALLLTGCSASTVGQRLDAAGDALEDRIEAVGDAIENAVIPAPDQSVSHTAAAEITREQAQTIALEHGGFTADQVTGLRTEYEIDDGIARYEVQFRQGRWEYDYEINAETGAILSYDRDD